MSGEDEKKCTENEHNAKNNVVKFNNNWRCCFCMSSASNLSMTVNKIDPICDGVRILNILTLKNRKSNV